MNDPLSGPRASLSTQTLLDEASGSYVYHILSRRRIVLLLLLLALVAGGGLGRKLSIGLFPKVARAQIGFGMPSGDLTPVDFFKKHGQIIEQSFQTIEDIKEIRGNYGPHWISYDLDFDWGIVAEDAKRQVEQRFGSLSLPQKIKDKATIYVRDAADSGSAIFVDLSSGTLLLDSVYQLAKQELLPRFSAIDGVASILLDPLEELVGNVTLDRQKMWQYNISPAQVADSLSRKNENSSVSSLRIFSEWVNLRLRESELSLYGLDELVVAERSGQPIYLKDIADIDIRREPPYIISRIDGRASLVFVILVESGANMPLVSRQLDKVASELQAENPLMSQVEFTRSQDPADYINLAIRNVLYAGLSGAVLAILVVVLFLGQLRNIVMIAFSIPLTITVSLILLYFRGISINMISLGGMTIATGMVVDASIVVTENIHRIRLEQPRLRAWQAIACATRQVWLPVLASTLTSIVVFFPLSFTAPLASAVLGDLAQTIVFALFSSLLIALLVVPLLAFYMLRSTDKNKGPAGQGSRHRFQGSAERLSERFSALLVACYRRLLSGFLGRRALQWGFIALSITLFALSLSVLGPRIRQSIIGTPSSNRVAIDIDVDPGYEDGEEFVALLDDLSEEARQIGGSEVERVYGQTIGPRWLSIILALSSSKHSTKVQNALQKYFDKRMADFNRGKQQQAAEQPGSSADCRPGTEEAAGSSAEAGFGGGRQLAVLDPARSYNVEVDFWDPGGLPLPQTNDLRLQFRGTEAATVLESLQGVRDLLANDQRQREQAAEQAFQQARGSAQDGQTALNSGHSEQDANPTGAENPCSGAEEPAEGAEQAESEQGLSPDDFFQGYRYSVSSKPSSTEPQPILNLLPRSILSRKFADLDLKKELKYALGATVSELKVDKKGSSETQTIRIRNPQGKGREYQDIYNHPVPVSVDKKTQYIPLHHFVRFEEDRQESYISSSNGKRQFYITIDLRTGESEATPSQIAEAQADINALLAANPDIMAPGVSYSWYNTQKEMQESIRSLTLALVIGLLLVFLVITAQFGSYRYPLIILVTVPLGITGSLFFLWLSHSTISLNSLLGMILLGGVAVNNAIIMIDFFLIILKERTGELLPGTAAERHRIKRAAIVDACSLRLTPILITMFTTLLGMLPIALALGDGMNVLQPLGIAVAGGLGVSTLFTLFMIPCLLNMVPGKRERSLSLRDLGREGI